MIGRLAAGPVLADLVSRRVDPEDTAAALRMAAGMAGALAVVFGTAAILYAVAGAAAAHAVPIHERGQDVSLGEAFSSAGRHAGGTVLLVLLLLLVLGGSGLASILGSAVLGGAAALAHPMAGAGVMILAVTILGLVVAFVMVRWGVAVPALVLRNLSATGAMRRSAALTRGHRMRVLLVYFLTAMAGYVTTFLLQGPFLALGYFLSSGGEPPGWTEVLSTISGGAGASLSIPLMMIAVPLLHLDLEVSHGSDPHGPGGSSGAFPR